jgi:xanthine dehydrogenase accessory factor
MDFRPIVKEMQQAGSVTLRTILEGEQAGQVIRVTDPQEQGCGQFLGQRCYTETYAHPAKLVIIGAGHVGTATAKLAAFVGFEVRVVDPRQELLLPERFPAGTELVEAPYEQLGDALPQAPAYYLVTTSSHIGDYDGAKQTLARPSHFVGMLGSRRKAALVRQWLERDGFSPEDIARLHSPVGLDIGGETPEEIAVSVVGQMIAHRHTTGANHIPSDLLEELSKPGAAGVLVTVIRKTGSTPRGPGSKLLVCRDGRLLGTVGGGVVEYESIRLARTLDTFALRTFQSGNGEAGVMACGGTMELMFQMVENGPEEPAQRI